MAKGYFQRVESSESFAEGQSPKETCWKLVQKIDDFSCIVLEVWRDSHMFSIS